MKLRCTLPPSAIFFFAKISSFLELHEFFMHTYPYTGGGRLKFTHEDHAKCVIFSWRYVVTAFKPESVRAGLNGDDGSMWWKYSPQIAPLAYQDQGQRG